MTGNGNNLGGWGGEVGASNLTFGGERISDDELKAAPVELLVYGVSVRKIVGGTNPKPMIVWSVLWKAPNGRAIARSVLGRAGLTRDLSFHASSQGLGFLTVDVPPKIERVDGAEVAHDVQCGAGDTVQAPAGEGTWALVDASGAVAVFYARVAIDKERGREAGKGRAYAYKVAGGSVALAQVRARHPELKALDLGRMIALPTLADLEAEGGEAPAGASPIVEDDDEAPARPKAASSRRRPR